MSETREERWARLKHERELNLEFCVCVINEAGTVTSPCAAHLDWLEAEQTKRIAELEVENKRMKAEIAPLIPPSKQARDVFRATLADNPEADMRPIPNQWLLRERARGDELNERIAELEAENKRLRGELRRVCENADELAAQFASLMSGYGNAMAGDLRRNCNSLLLSQAEAPKDD